MDYLKPFKLLKPWACTITNVLIEDRRYLPGQLEQRVLEQIPVDYFKQTEADLAWEPEPIEAAPVVVAEVVE